MPAKDNIWSSAIRAQLPPKEAPARRWNGEPSPLFPSLSGDRDLKRDHGKPRAIGARIASCDCASWCAAGAPCSSRKYEMGAFGAGTCALAPSRALRALRSCTCPVFLFFRDEALLIGTSVAWSINRAIPPHKNDGKCRALLVPCFGEGGLLLCSLVESGAALTCCGDGGTRFPSRTPNPDFRHSVTRFRGSILSRLPSTGSRSSG